MELKIIILFFVFGYSQAQLASHLIFPLENYLKSIPPFTFPQPATVPVDGKTVTVSAPEKETLVKGTKSRINKAFVTETSATDEPDAQDIKTTTEEPEQASTASATRETDYENTGETDDQVTLKSNRLPPGTEEIAPSPDKSSRIQSISAFRIPEIKTTDETATSLLSTSQSASSLNPVTSASASTSSSTTSTTGKSTTVKIPTPESVSNGDIGQQLLARFRPKSAADFNALTNSRASASGTNREFLKNIPHIKFTDPAGSQTGSS